MTLVRIAARNLLRNRRRTLLSLAAITVGVGAMVAFQGFVNGQRAMMLGNLVQGQTGAVQVHRKGYLANVQGLPLSLDMVDTPELRAKLRSVPGVLEIAPRISFGAMLGYPDQVPADGDPDKVIPGKSAFFIATAIDPVAEAKVTPRRFDWLSAGRLFDAREPGVVLNGDFARSLGAPITPQPPKDDSAWPALQAPDRDGAMNGELVSITGAYTQGTPGDKKNGLVNLEVAQRLLRMEGRVTEYAIAVKSMDDAHAVRDQLKQVLGPDYEVHAWDEILPFIKDLVGLQDFFLRMVGVIFLITVLLGIANSMLMNVLERVREIGTMMAVGTHRAQVRTQFVLEGAALGVAGGVLGAALGFAIVSWLHHVGIPFKMPGSQFENVLRPAVTFGYLGVAAVISSVGASLAALWPAARASKLQPVDALRSV